MNAVHIGDDSLAGPWSSPSRGCLATSSGSGSATRGWSRNSSGSASRASISRVKDEGIVGPDDSIEHVHTDENRVTLTDMFRLILDRHASPESLRRALAVPALAQVWREEFEARLVR